MAVFAFWLVDLPFGWIQCGGIFLLTSNSSAAENLHACINQRFRGETLIARAHIKTAFSLFETMLDMAELSVLVAFLYFL